VLVATTVFVPSCQFASGSCALQNFSIILTRFRYEYYFEKDVVSGACVDEDVEGGHTHDWENVVVFVDDADDGSLRMVAGSCHGGYDEDFGSGASSWTETPEMEGEIWAYPTTRVRTCG
jgi:hypothetical protein